MNKKAYVIQLLTSPQARLLITHDEYIAALLAYFPIGNQSVITSSDEPRHTRNVLRKKYSQSLLVHQFLLLLILHLMKSSPVHWPIIALKD